MRKIKFSVCAIFALVAVCTLLLAFVGAEGESWTDKGNYSELWLGDYDSTSAYIVEESDQLAAFLVSVNSGRTFEGKTIKLEANIDMSGKYWSIGTEDVNAFLGTFDGNGYIISGVEIKSDNDVGAFLYSNKGIVKDFCLSIASPAKRSAGIAMNNEGTIQNCAVVGKLGGDSALGCAGIAYENSGTISGCYSTAELKSASAELGGVKFGISAVNTSLITNCIWSGADLASATGDGAELSAIIDKCVAYTDNVSLLTALNDYSAANGYPKWTEDKDGRFGYYPVMENGANYIKALPISGISFETRQLTLYPGDEYTIKVKFYPEHVIDNSLVWLSTNSSVATVDENGKITAKTKGYTTIRATTVDGGKIANCAVTVTDDRSIVLSQNIILDKNEYKILIGQTAQILPVISPANATNKKVIYSVLDESVATCDENGLLTPVGAGNTVVTVTAEDKNSSISALVSVLEESYSETWSGSASTEFGGGDGTKLNPYIISAPEHLAKLANDVNGGNSYEGMYFLQKISIRLNDTTFEDWQNKLTVRRQWTPIGNKASNAFAGNYDGGGFSINGIYITETTDAAGLFGYIKGGTVKNVNIKHSIIRAGKWSGALVGFNSAQIYRCSVLECSISGSDYVGAVAGYTTGYVDYCVSSSSVIGENNVGGIVGCADYVVTNCINTGDVSGNSCVGGICGKTTYVIENSYNSGTISASTTAGGIVGTTTRDVINCFCMAMPMVDGEYSGSIAGYAPKVLSSYGLYDNTICGNLPNSDSYTLLRVTDGTLRTYENNVSYLSILDRYVNCIFSDTYFVWVASEDGYNITYGPFAKTLASVSDIASGVELLGSEIQNGDYYIFEDFGQESIKALLAKINQSSLFEKNKLNADSILSSKSININSNYATAENNQRTSYRLTMPLDLQKMAENNPDYGEFELFSHIAIVNITSQEMLIYIPDYVAKAADGSYIGTVKALSHIVSGLNVTNYGEMASRYSFKYKDGTFSLSALNTSDWVIVEIGENENIQPIETGGAEVTTPFVEQEKIEYKFSVVFAVVIAVLLAFGGIGVILVQRSKNNIRIRDNY